MTRRKIRKAFEYEYIVPWVDTDALGIMHFSNYFKICERAEQSYFEYRNMEENYGIYLPRVHASCEFKRPLRFRDRAVISVKLSEVGKGHMTFQYSIKNRKDGELNANCSIVVASVDKNMKPLDIPSELLAKLQ